MPVHYEGSEAWYLGRKSDYSQGKGRSPSLIYREGSAHEDTVCDDWESAEDIAAFRALDSITPILFYVPVQGAQPVFAPLPQGTEVAFPVPTQGRIA